MFYSIFYIENLQIKNYQLFYKYFAVFHSIDYLTVTWLGSEAEPCSGAS